MRTIHITSQDELPQVAEAVIRSLGRRTVVAFRGEMGAGKTTLIKRLLADALKGEQVVLIENEFGEIGIDSTRARAAAASTISTSTASTTCARRSTSGTKSISIRATSAWWSGPRRSNRCCPTM